MDIVESERHKDIVKYAKKLYKTLKNVNDKESIEVIRLKSQSYLDQYNKHYLTVKNPTKYELGKFKMVLKNIIQSNYTRNMLEELINKVNYDYEFICKDCRIYDNKDDDEDWCYNGSKLCKQCKKKYEKMELNNSKLYIKKWKIHDEYNDAIEKTNFTKELRNKWILLNREIKKSNDKNNPLIQSIKESIKIEILNTFQKQNKNLITKY